MLDILQNIIDIEDLRQINDYYIMVLPFYRALREKLGNIPGNVYTKECLITVGYSEKNKRLLKMKCGM